jgi:hypothetical protein
MHCLENMLLILSERIRKETGNQELADDAAGLAGASHNYMPEFLPFGGKNADEMLAPQNDDWNRRYRR